MWPAIFGAAIPASAAIIAAVVAARSASSARTSEQSAAAVRDLENRIADRKVKVYEPMIELLRRMLDPNESATIMADERKFREDLSKFGAWVTIYGSDEAVIYFERFMQCTYRAAPAPVMIRMYVEFVLAARRDMGYPDTGITGEHIMGIRLKDTYDPEWFETLTTPLWRLYEREAWTAPWQDQTDHTGAER
ncbi:MAG TPA: hypothetical protein VGK32_08645 [Vicinamibacterales bacterium]|jgi:hypothetical protein